MIPRAEGVVAAHPLFQSEGGGSSPTSALQFVFLEISARTACNLNAMWHSLLPRTDLGNILCGNMTVCFGAYFDDAWSGVAIYSQPIVRSLCDGSTIELRRLALNNVCPKNTASRMLSVTCKLVKRKYPFIRRYISYQAVDVHKGTIYKAAGWRPAGEIVAARPQRLTGSNQRATGPLQTNSRKLRWEKLLEA